MADQLHEWHDFYLLIGTAAATLIGLTFVAASVGAGATFDAKRAANWQSFLTPTVLHFSAVLIACLIALAPVGASLGVLLLALGIVGVVWGSRHWVGMRRRGLTQQIDLADRLLYLRLPIVGYLLLAAAAVVLLVHKESGLIVLALALVLLLLLGIRNAWDMTVWIVVRRPDS
ncbi:MAG TPA: hypothetical protein VIG49_04800 [Acetobacteraceae bacterium]